MLQEGFYDDRCESVPFFDGIPVFGSPQGSFFFVITVSSCFIGIL